MILKEFIKTDLVSGVSAGKFARAWAEWILSFNEPWAWYGHLTFKEDVHPEAANKTWKLFINVINRKLYGNNSWRIKHLGLRWVRATEYQKRGVLHYHCLISPGYDLNVFKNVSAFDLIQFWDSLAGICRIYPYKIKGGAEEYITKSSYAFKRGMIDFSENIKRSSNDIETVTHSS